MKTLIVDDEILARKKIVDLLEKYEQIEIIQECSNGRIAISEINKLKPDIVFLDIELKDINGFQVVQNISLKPLIIFISSQNQHALKAFDFGGFDFLLKPIKEDRLMATVKQALKFFEEKEKKNYTLGIISKSDFEIDPKKNMSFLPIRKGNKTILLETATIQYILASGSYSEVCTKDKKHVIRESLNHLMSILNSDIFFRIHRSAIINSKFIQEIVHSDYSEIDVRMEDEHLIRVSKSQKTQFLDKLGI